MSKTYLKSDHFVGGESLERPPATGFSKIVPTAKPTETSRRMGMLQTVIDVLDASTGKATRS
jgi:hypothetical protein